MDEMARAAAAAGLAGEMPEGTAPVEEPAMPGGAELIDGGLAQIEQGLEELSGDVGKQVRSHVEAIRQLVSEAPVDEETEVPEEPPMGEEV